MTPETIEDQIKKISLLFRYGAKEKIFIFIGVSLFGLATWISKGNEFLKLPPELNQPIAIGLYVLGGLCLAWVAYRFLFKLALPKPHGERELPNAIKGLLAFTQEDGELFRKLGRDQELNSLNNFVKDPQIPMVAIMGDPDFERFKHHRPQYPNIIESQTNKPGYTGHENQQTKRLTQPDWTNNG